MEYIKAGRLRALAVTSATRAAALPDVPAISEFVPGFEALSWFGVVAPRAIPAVIAETLNRQVNAGLADPKIKEFIASWGETVFAVSITESVKFIADQNEKWGTVIRTAGIRAE
jgi:tripartite-type tricarboxylate transporter receptor subunit TctC